MSDISQLDNQDFIEGRGHHNHRRGQTLLNNNYCGYSNCVYFPPHKEIFIHFFHNIQSPIFAFTISKHYQQNLLKFYDFILLYFSHYHNYYVIIIIFIIIFFFMNNVLWEQCLSSITIDFLFFIFSFPREFRLHKWRRKKKNENEK